MPRATFGFEYLSRIYQLEFYFTFTDILSLYFFIIYNDTRMLNAYCVGEYLDEGIYHNKDTDILLNIQKTKASTSIKQSSISRNFWLNRYIYLCGWSVT